MVSIMKIADTKSGAPFRVRVNRTGRRTYSREYKREIVEECGAPGVSVAAIALSHGINANIVRKWIEQAGAGRFEATQAMVPVVLAPSAPMVSAERPPRRTSICSGVIEIELESARVRVRGAVDAAALRAVLEALARR